MDHRTEIRIFIAHSQHLFRKGLCALLSEQPSCKVVGDAPDFRGTSEEIQRYAPEILLYDASLIGSSKRHSAFPSHRIIFIANEDQIGALRQESMVAVLRSDTPEVIGEAVRRLAGLPIANGEASIATKDLRALASSTEAFPSSPLLTPREKEILQILVGGHTAREVAEELSLSVKTVEAHKLNLMRKLGVHNRSALIRYALANSTVASVTHRG